MISSMNLAHVSRLALNMNCGLHSCMSFNSFGDAKKNLSVTKHGKIKVVDPQVFIKIHFKSLCMNHGYRLNRKYLYFSNFIISSIIVIKHLSY